MQNKITILGQIEQNAFIQGMVTGELTQRQRDYYVAQDQYYLQAFDAYFDQVVAQVAPQWQMQLPVLGEAEADAHAALRPGSGVAQIAKDSVNQAYLLHLKLALDDKWQPLAGMVALLPCIESYYLIAVKFQQQAATTYHGWFDYYAGLEYQQLVEWFWRVINAELQQVLPQLTADDWHGLQKIYQQSYQDEFNFWQVAAQAAE